jgi:hypothetical protein
MDLEGIENRVVGRPGRSYLQFSGHEFVELADAGAVRVASN